jgi:HTH-type transcriptional regulator, sugar sensing transcriptional regulator
MDLQILNEAGLTKGEGKVYLKLLELGSSTTGPIIEKTKISRSIIYQILEKLIEKGLVSYIIKDKTKYFSASNPKKIIEFIESKEENLLETRNKVEKILPELLQLRKTSETISVQIYEGFKGIQTAFENYHSVLKKDEGYYSFGMYPEQEERYHAYWKRDHKKRIKEKIHSFMLFNKGTSEEILKNRNSYKYCDSRYMPINIKTPAWFMVYENVSTIFLQTKPEMAIQIKSKELSETFKSYFDNFWKKSKPFN